MTNERMRAEALDRATTNQSMMNYPAIFEGFIAKGIPGDQIEPRKNVFTYNAWIALGRQVRKGEHGVKVVTWVVVEPKDNDDGTTTEGYRKPHTTTVFHISQTDEAGERPARRSRRRSWRREIDRSWNGDERDSSDYPQYEY